MGTSNRERREAKQRRRDQRRGVPAGGPADGSVVPRADVGRGLPPETLRALLRRAGTDLADGREEALGELRHLLAEHLARRRVEILTACDEVVADAGRPSGGVDTLPPALLAALDGSAPPVASWADAAGISTEDAALATVRLLAATAP